MEGSFDWDDCFRKLEVLSSGGVPRVRTIGYCCMRTIIAFSSAGAVLRPLPLLY